MDMFFDCGCDIRESHLFGCFGWHSAFWREAVVESNICYGGTQGLATIELDRDRESTNLHQDISTVMSNLDFD
jgi:hypothetical protein